MAEMMVGKSLSQPARAARAAGGAADMFPA
jgi:hypothetical protein